MAHDGPNPLVILVRAGVFGVVMGLFVGLIVSTFLEIMDDAAFNTENVLVGTGAGLGIGTITGLILGLTLVVTNIHAIDSPVPRITISLMAVFVVGGLAGLFGVNAIQVAGLFGAPAAIAVWIVYPMVIKKEEPESSLA